jgi:hypothetical protein
VSNTQFLDARVKWLGRRREKDGAADRVCPDNRLLACAGNRRSRLGQELGDRVCRDDRSARPQNHHTKCIARRKPWSKPAESPGCVEVDYFEPCLEAEREPTGLPRPPAIPCDPLRLGGRQNGLPVGTITGISLKP